MRTTLTHLDGAVLGAGGEAVAPVGEGQVQDLVVVLRQGLHLLTGDAVVQALELPVPRHGGYERARTHAHAHTHTHTHS